MSDWIGNPYFLVFFIIDLVMVAYIRGLSKGKQTGFIEEFFKFFDDRLLQIKAVILALGTLWPVTVGNEIWPDISKPIMVGAYLVGLIALACTATLFRDFRKPPPGDSKP